MSAAAFHGFAFDPVFVIRDLDELQYGHSVADLSYCLNKVCLITCCWTCLCWGHTPLAVS